MPGTIIPLQDEHLGDAAELFVKCYRAERRQVPTLPERYEDPESILPLLRDLVNKAPGVAAVRDGELVGYLSGVMADNLRGKRSIYTPIWAHATISDGRRELYREMYANISPQWLANGCFQHALTMFAHERTSIDAFFWLGFGLIVVDAMRDMEPILVPETTSRPKVEIRRAGTEDIETVLELDEALRRHLASPPIYLPFVTKQSRQAQEDWFAKARNAFFLAFQENMTDPVAWLSVTPATLDSAYIIRDEGTASVTGAYTKPTARGRGVGSALLNHALAWARSQGYVRLAVDFESQNIAGARFWLGHFQPICYSLLRAVDERITWAHGQRRDHDIW